MNKNQVEKLTENNRRLSMTVESLGDDLTYEIEPIEVKRHGYNTPCGGWTKYATSAESPAFFLIHRRKHKRKHSGVNIREIRKLKPA